MPLPDSRWRCCTAGYGVGGVVRVSKWNSQLLKAAVSSREPFVRVQVAAGDGVWVLGRTCAGCSAAPSVLSPPRSTSNLNPFQLEPQRRVLRFPHWTEERAPSYVRAFMQIRWSRIWTRRNEIWWRRRTWRTEHRESAAVLLLLLLLFGGLKKKSGCCLLWDFHSGKFSSGVSIICADKCVEVDFVVMLWRATFSGGIITRAGGFSPLTVPTLCRGWAAVSGERARSCRCPRAGRKPGITMAECFTSTTTPGKLRGLTPEIGMM